MKHPRVVFFNLKIKLVRGFTLIEVLLVIAILAILASVVIIAINPAKQLGEAQNAQRRSDIRTILDAVHQYAVDNSGLLPSEEIPVGVLCTDDGNEICTSNMSCDGVNLDELLVDEKYLISIPVDPTSDPEGQVSGYFIFQTESGRVGVCAQSAYGGADISVLR